MALTLQTSIEKAWPALSTNLVPETKPEDYTDLLQRCMRAQRMKKVSDVVLQKLMNEILDMHVLSKSVERIGASSVYQFNDIKLIRGPFVTSGGYNRIFRCEAVHGDGPESDKTGAVLRLVRHDPQEEEEIIIMAFIEVTINVVLTSLTKSVVPTYFPVKTVRRSDPGYDYGSVMVNAGSNTLHEWLVANERKIDDGQMFTLFGLVAATLFELQREYRFVHRDLKEDNIMLVPTDDAEIECNGHTYPTMGFKVQFLDFGFSELRFESNERLACDPEDFLVSKKPRFNNSIDMVYLAFTMLEDGGPGMKHRAPRFTEMLDKMASPLYDHILDKYENYENDGEDTRNEALLECVYKFVKPDSWAPEKVLRLIRSHHQKSDASA